MSHILQEFQKASGAVVSINNICKIAHLLDSHGRVGEHKPFVTKSNYAAWLRWCQACRK